MKKLLAIIASAAMTLGAFADDEPATTFAYTNSFESASEEGVLDSDGLVLDLDGSIWGTTAPAADAEGIATITPYSEATKPTTSAGNNYLKLDTGSYSIFRKFGGSAGNAVMMEKVFVDTYVKFTISEGAPSTDLNDAQFALWIQTDGEDGSSTNLMVRCGYINDSYETTPTTVVANLPVDFDIDAWQHVVVKPIADRVDAPIGGFIITINGTTIAAKTSDLFDSAIAEELFADYAELFKAGKVFPSAKDSSKTDTGLISSVGFIGNGEIDLVSVTEGAEEPGPEPGTVEFTLKAPTDTTIASVVGATDKGAGLYEAESGAQIQVTLNAASGKIFSDGTTSTEVTLEAAAGELTIDLGNIKVEDAAAQIGTVLYLTLADAVSAAADGNTVTLLADVTLDNYTLTKKITLDLAGFDLTGGTSTGQHKIFTLLNGADLTVNGTNSTITGNFYLGVNNGVNAANLTLNGGTYQQAEGVQEAVLQTNGGDTGAKLITATGCSFTSEDIAVYLAGPADTVLTDCDIVAGLTGIEIRAGELEVVGTTIKATYTPTEAEANGNGSASKGAGIAVVQHTTKQAISVTVGEGTEIDAYTAFYEANPQKNAAADLEKINIALNAGTYKYTGQATNYASVRIEDADVIGAVIPGTSTAMFQTDASDYCAEGYETVLDESDNYYKVAAKAVAKIDNVNYATLAAALDAAVEGDTVTLLADTTLDKYVLAKKVVLDLDGYDLSSSVPTGGYPVYASRQIIKLIDGADLTIDGEGSTVSGNIYIGVKGGTTSSLVLNGGTYVNDTNSLSELPEDEQATQACLQTLGTDKTGTKTIVLNGCTFTAPGAPIYLAGNAEAIFNNCTITGDQAVAMKGGSLTINGGTYTAIGAENIPTAGRSNGIESSGAAIQIESNSAYSDIAVEIKDATVVSQNGPAVYEYLGSTETKATRVQDIALKGGSYTAGGSYDAIILSEAMEAVPGLVDGVRNTAVFSTDVSEYCEEGYETTWNEDTQSWGVKQIMLTASFYADMEKTDLVDEQIVAYGTAPTNVVVTKEGYTFTGWDPEISKITEDTEYTAQFNVNTYYVQTFTNGVEYVQVQYTFGDQSITLTDPVFASDEEWDGKWYTSADGDTEWTFDGTVAGNTQEAYAKITKKAGPEYPANWPATDDATKAKFAEWVAGKGADAQLDTDEAKNAFLLNCTVDEVAAETAAFKITAFTGTAASVDTPKENTKGDAFNGNVTVKAFSDVTCETEVDPASQAELFFKAVLDFPAAE